MRVLRPGALLASFCLSSPTIYAAFVTGSVSANAAILRFLLLLVPCGIALGLLDGLLDAYAEGVGRRPPADAGDGGRRRTDVVSSG